VVSEHAVVTKKPIWKFECPAKTLLAAPMNTPTASVKPPRLTKFQGYLSLHVQVNTKDKSMIMASIDWTGPTVPSSSGSGVGKAVGAEE
jgi:hypothetical protein